jgi:hypothetical protein
MKSTFKSLLVMVAGIAAVVVPVMAQEHNTPEVFKSDVTMDKGSKVHVNGSWDIGGTVVTATAANLNSGVASSTAGLVSNALLKVYGSNLETVASGTVKLGQATAVTGAGATLTISNVTETAGGVFVGLTANGGTIAGTVTNGGTISGGTVSGSALASIPSITFTGAILTNGAGSASNLMGNLPPEVSPSAWIWLKFSVGTTNLAGMFKEIP